MTSATHSCQTESMQLIHGLVHAGLSLYIPHFELTVGLSCFLYNNIALKNDYFHIV